MLFTNWTRMAFLYHRIFSEKIEWTLNNVCSSNLLNLLTMVRLKESNPFGFNYATEVCNWI